MNETKVVNVGQLTATIQNLFINDARNQKAIKEGWKPSTDHILAQLTKQYDLTVEQQQRIHQIGCQIYGLTS